MSDGARVMGIRACPICESAVAGEASRVVDDGCGECAHLLRWFRGYFSHDPTFGETWWITPQTTFVELGVESLDWMCWLLEAEEKLGIDIPDQDFEKLYTVGQFVRYLRARGASWPS